MHALIFFFWVFIFWLFDFKRSLMIHLFMYIFLYIWFSLLGESIPQHKKYLNCKCSLFSSSVSPSVATVNIGTNIIQSHIFIRTSRFGLKRKCILDCQYLWIYIFVEFFLGCTMRKNKKKFTQTQTKLGEVYTIYGENST